MAPMAEPGPAPSATSAAGAGQVLVVGIAALDIVLEVAAYPVEDAEIRALNRRHCRGGNAANTLTILADLGRNVAFAGTLADDAGGAVVRADLQGRGIDLSGARRVPGAGTPTSYILLSRATGSRTIVHFRDLPEFSADDFAGIPLDDWDWIHFEGRNPDATAAMVARVQHERPDLPISIEFEKPRPGIERLLRRPAPLATAAHPPARPGRRVLIFARAFAAALGQYDPAAFLCAQAAASDADLLIAPWGAAGAWALVPGQSPLHAPPHVPARVIDSIAAGDVFNAALIDGLLDGLAPLDLLARANRLAGHGCGQVGIDGVVASARQAGLIIRRG